MGNENDPKHVMETYVVKEDGIELIIDVYPRAEIEKLKERIRLGNKKLNEAWEIIRKLENSDHWKAELQKWHLANVRLSAYCSQLKMLGFSDCLYINAQGVKYRACLEPLGCRVCPSSISYWGSELMNLPGASRKGK